MVLLLLRVAPRGLLLPILLLLLLLLLRRVLLIPTGLLMLLQATVLSIVVARCSFMGRCVFEPAYRSACAHLAVGLVGLLDATTLGLIRRNDHNPPG